MNERNEVSYRLRLAQGFAKEAEQDFGLERWRSCVDNAQIAAENAGKAVLALFGVPPKTHQPSRALSHLIQSSDVSLIAKELIERMLPDLLTLGEDKHFLTDYGDETTYTLPWDLFTRDLAEQALSSARRSLALAEAIVREIRAE